jgi:hypothetical protein
MDLKYVIDHYNNVMIYTGNSVSHKDMARVMFGKPVSAGFIRFDLDYIKKCAVYGESVSLNLKSRGTIDEDIIYNHLFKN